MRASKSTTGFWCAAALFVLLGIAAALTGGLTGRTEVLVDLSALTEPSQQTLECIRSGDFAGLEEMLYGAPRLGTPCGEGSGPEDLLWNAYLESIRYDFPGTYTRSGEVLELDAQIECLDLNAVMKRMNDLTITASDSREAALREAAARVLAEDPPTVSRELKLQLIRADGAWQVVPTTQLQQLLSGFITEQEDT